MPPARIDRFYRDLGFGAPPQTGFPGEAKGLVRPWAQWRPIEQATMSYGHGISVSLLQLARAYTIFPNAGRLLPLSLLKTQGEPIGRPVVSRETASEVTRMLEMAVQPGGTAPRAQVPGYRVAGKTGTAHKPEERRLRRVQVRLLVRRLRPGLRPALHRRGDARRAAGRSLPRRR